MDMVTTAVPKSRQAVRSQPSQPVIKTTRLMTGGGNLPGARSGGHFRSQAIDQFAVIAMRPPASAVRVYIRH